jgi:GST-like protein
MIKLYTWTTPNGFKTPVMLEECGLDYEIIPIDISKGEQKTPEYLKLNPNGKIPTIVDGEMTIFESGAILIYLAEKTGKFLPKEEKGRFLTLEWLMFQMGGIGPMLGQATHFIKYAPEKVEYGIKRYSDEAERIYGVVEKRLEESEYLAGEYSIADMAAWPWLRNYETIKLDISKFPKVKKWLEKIENRPAVKRALEKTDQAAKNHNS